MGQQRGHQAQQQANKVEGQQREAATRKRNEDPVEAMQEWLGTRAASRQWRSQMQSGNSAQPLQQMVQAISPVSPQSQGKPLFRGVSHGWGGVSSGLVVQPKLTIGEPNDRYEQEADRVAQQVVHQIQSSPVAQTGAGGKVQRQTEEEVQRKSESLLLGEPAGGKAASGELEASIRQAKGEGVPLPETVREPMEQAFGGVDFSGVRIHANAQADALNRSISAKAFTTGQDVFLRQGAYQPGSREGQELLAHELTHVVQQQGVQHIQRKIGFEFETAVVIKKDDESQLGDKQEGVESTRKGPDNKPVWKIVSDTGKMEFVTGVFDEEEENELQELARMILVFYEIEAFIKKMNQLNEESKKSENHLFWMDRDHLENKANFTENVGKRIAVGHYVDTALYASPQMTAGIRLDRVRHVAEKVKETQIPIFEEFEKDDREKFSGDITMSGMNPPQGELLARAAKAAAIAGKEIASKHGDVQPIDIARYEGFLAIVLSYIMMGAEQQNEWKYIKLIAPLMSRIPFNKYFAELSPQFNEHFTVENVLELAGVKDGQLFSKGISGNNLTVTRKDWIESIRNKEKTEKDLVSEFESQETDGGSMSRQKEFDETSKLSGRKEKLIQLEFRRLPSMLKPELWKEFAKELYLTVREWEQD